MKQLEDALKDLRQVNIELNQLDLVDNINVEKVLCDHCKRTISNGKRCIGACVADNEY
tara:strand:+ start:32 stop:205 length:174 start_codon:yes stop_codon:yes gene_type:complete